jgi:hypothetical protein
MIIIDHINLLKISDNNHSIPLDAITEQMRKFVEKHDIKVELFHENKFN